jgi:hypothetical protein
MTDSCFTGKCSNGVQSPNTLYNEMQTIFDDIVSIHNNVVKVANQLWFALPDLTHEPILAEETTIRNETIRNELIKIKTILSETKSRAENLSVNVK